MNQLRLKCGLIWTGIGLALLYLITESYLDLFDAGHEGTNYIERLFASGDTNELRMRLTTIGLLIVLSVYAQTLVNRLRGAVRDAGETHAILASMVENAVDAIDSKTLDGTILGLNSSAERLYGYSEELKGKNIAVLTPPEHLDEMLDSLQRAGRDEVVSQHDTVRESKNGRRTPESGEGIYTLD